MTVALIGGGGIAEGIANVVPNCRMVTADVRNASVVSTALAPHFIDHPVTAVVVTAGVSHPAPVEPENFGWEWHREIDTNLTGAYNCACACITHRIPTIIFIASVAGLHGKPGHAGYCASKAGVISLMQSMAFEGHDAYAISPGRVDTPMRERDYPNDTPGSRLHPTQIGEVVSDILAGGYEPGDNICIRKVGLEETILSVDKGAPWRERLAIGKPVTI